MDSTDFDLNGLRALDVLLRERHVSRAARILGISQPAMSRALARLRDQFDDDLLVRTETGLGLTARAETLVEPVRKILTDASALVHPQDFNPASLNEQVTLAGLDMEFRLLLPGLSGRLALEAPSLSLRAIQFTQGDFGILDRGEADFVLTAIESRGGRYRRRLLFNDRHVTLMNARLARRIGPKLSMEDFLSLDHGLVSVEGHGEGLVDGALRAQGLRRRVVLRVPNFSLLPSILAARDILFTVPRRIVTTFPRSPRLEIRKPPVGLDDAVFYLYWHARNHHNPAHAWLRQQLFEVTAELEPPST
jgi:DNA-binding transcriptional LysR family regulator